MKLLLTTILGLFLFVGNVSSQSLMNLIQWEESDGGNGHWYAVMSEQYHWSDALAAAASLSPMNGQHSYLATITSYEENQFIFENLVYNSITPLYGDQAWLGGYDAGGGDWQWITNEEFDYTNWAPDEPNNPGSELTMSMWDLDTDPDKPNQVPGMWNNSLAEERDWWSIVEWGEAPDLHPPTIPEPSTIVLLALGLGALAIKKLYSK